MRGERDEFAAVMQRRLAGASEAARGGWVEFAKWADTTWHDPADVAAARRAERFATPEIVDALAAAFAAWRPPVYPSSLRTLRYALYLAVAGGRADLEIASYLERLLADKVVSDAFRRAEFLHAQRYLEWAGRAGVGPLADALQRGFALDLFQQDPALVWARSRGLSVAETARWSFTAFLKSKPGARARGETFSANLFLTVNYPAQSPGGCSVQLTSSLNYPKQPYAIYDVQVIWPTGREITVRAADPELADRFSPSRLPRIEGIDEFPDFLRGIEALIGATFDPRTISISGLTAGDRSVVKRWLAGAKGGSKRAGDASSK